MPKSEPRERKRANLPSLKSCCALLALRALIFLSLLPFFIRRSRHRHPSVELRQHPRDEDLVRPSGGRRLRGSRNTAGLGQRPQIPHQWGDLDKFSGIRALVERDLRLPDRTKR